MISCEPFTLCWIAWAIEWPQLLICLLLTVSLGLAHWRELRKGERQSIRMLRTFCVILLVPAAASLVAVGLDFGWRNEPAIGHVLRFLGGSETLFMVFLFSVSGFVGGVSYLLVSQRATVPSLFWGKAVRARNIIAWSLLAYGMMLLVHMLASLLGYGSVSPLPLFASRESALIRYLLLAFPVLIGPAAEECFFRGLLQPKLIEQFGASRGIFLQAAAFGLYHLNLGVGLAVHLCAGLILGVALYRSKSLYSTIAAHSISNAIAAYVSLTAN
jgi:membrane protease YdiL (CAAX protease family)